MNKEPDYQIPAHLESFFSLVDATSIYGIELADKTAFTTLEQSLNVAQNLSYGQLMTQARQLAAEFQRRNLKGKRVMLLYPQGVEFVVAFVACLHAGVVAVPAHFARPGRHGWKRLESMSTDADVVLVLTLDEKKDKLCEWFAGSQILSKIEVLATDRTDLLTDQAWQPFSPQPDDIVFFQYTSGSTGDPKAVVVTHKNLYTNAIGLDQAWDIHRDSIVVSWLPVSHDLGLIGNVLQSLFMGATCHIMTPVAFIKQPFCWLNAISTMRGTVSMAPNFAYDLCVKKVTPEQMAQLDLSCWQIAANAAEPIRSLTLDTFIEKFEPVGFKPSAFHNAYGMAEVTLLVTCAKHQQEYQYCDVDIEGLESGRFVPQSQASENTQVMVSSGRVLDVATLRIVDPFTCRLSDTYQIGEIWAKGEHIADGYWQKPEQTAEVFNAYVLDDHDKPIEGPYLRTGDLGYIHQGEIYICGRHKDLIIIHGVNHYPQDIELTMQNSHDALVDNSGAAFSMDIDGEETLVVVQEVERVALRNLHAPEVFNAIEMAIFQEHELNVHEIVLIKPATLPKTTSGKVQRRLTRNYLKNGELSIVARSSDFAEELPGEAVVQDSNAQAPAQPAATDAIGDTGGKTFTRQKIHQMIADWLMAQLKVPQQALVGNVPFSHFKLDSISAVELTAFVEQQMGRAFLPEIIWSYPTIDKLTGYLHQLQFGSESVEEQPAASQSDATSAEVEAQANKVFSDSELDALSDDALEALLRSELDHK